MGNYCKVSTVQHRKGVFEGADIAINYSVHLHKVRKLKAVIRSKIALGQLCATNGTATDAQATATNKNHFKKDSGKTKMKMVG
jgi:hypothetical protein